MFIEVTDLYTKINQTILDQITGGDTDSINDAEATASAIITDSLEKAYDLDAQWQTTGSARNRRLVHWMINLMCYFLYSSVPDEAVPERIVKDYDDTRAELQKIEDGKKSINLPRKTNEIGQKRTKFRWGSLPPRQHTI